MTQKFSTFAEAEEYIHSFIPPKGQYFKGDFGINRTKALLSILGNPHNKLKTIHLAGTSGKGSTAYLTSLLLMSQGFKTGLHLSPHLLDIRERFQINNSLLSDSEFCTYVSSLVSAVEELSNTEHGKPSYFELLVVLAFCVFADQKVDYAVIETGLGGLHDATNVLRMPNKLVLLTPIGMDHMHILGPTLSHIAEQKARIMHPGNMALSTTQEPKVKRVFNRVAEEQQSTLKYISAKLPAPYKQSDIGLFGAHQIQNASLALAALTTLSARDGFSINEKSARKALVNAHFPGRFETITTSKGIIILDGAHNPPKMKAFTLALATEYPRQHLVFVVAFKQGKDIASALKYIAPIARHIFITTFFSTTQDTHSLSHDPENIQQELRHMGYNHITILHNNIEAINAALLLSKPIVITGSLYLLSDIYPYIKSL
jgi:dihydrofolate synthase/folylpolyglutamate synthase